MCKKEHIIFLNKEEKEALQKWYDGMYIQDAFPEWNPMEREFLKTGYCPTCQKLLFGANYESDRIRESEGI